MLSLSIKNSFLVVQEKQNILQQKLYYKFNLPKWKRMIYRIKVSINSWCRRSLKKLKNFKMVIGTLHQNSMTNISIRNCMWARSINAIMKGLKLTLYLGERLLEKSSYKKLWLKWNLLRLYQQPDSKMLLQRRSICLRIVWDS